MIGPDLSPLLLPQETYADAALEGKIDAMVHGRSEL